MNLGPIRAVTFDCYGTLVDWEAGIQSYVAPLLERAARAGKVVSPSEWLATWEAAQFAMLAPWRPYADIMVDAFNVAMRTLELESFADGGPGLARSLGEWAPFADTIPALRRIARRRRRLGIVSNVDRALIADTLGRLMLPWSMVVTAEEARAYKPDAAPFRMAIERLGLAPEAILHCAFGWRYDLAPARALGLRTCFVNRGGAPRPDGAEADLEVPSLGALADLFDAAP